MSGSNDDGAYDPYAPRQPNARPKGATDDDALDDVAAAIRDGEMDDALLRLGRSDPHPGGKLNGVRPGEWKPDEYGLPPGCPVLPLGTDTGTYYFLDTIGQLRAMKGGDLGQSGINELFMGRHLWLVWAFPKSVRDVITSWRPERVREALMAACARKGAWSPRNAVRGRGMWRGRDGRLILHCGDRLYSARGEEPLGEMEGRVYPTRPPIAKPWQDSLKGKRGPLAQLLPHLQTWKWSRPQLDPILLVGSIAVGYLGDAAGKRPAAFITGDKGTGKSALHDDLKALQGEWLLHTGDTTSAGLYQELQFDCIPVAIDEFEAKPDNRKAKAVVELMRLSYSGAPMNRGGDNHKGTQFHGRSAFRFSSIVMPPMEGSDLSRMVQLRLTPLDQDAVKPVIPEHELAELGRKILRRLLDNWHRWDVTLAAWRQFLGSCGHDGRGQDTFGTLLAAADLAIGDDAIALELDMGPGATDGEYPFERWRPLLQAEKLTEQAATEDNWRLCLGHLMNKRIDAWRGGTRHTIGEVLTEFWEADRGNPDALSYTAARKLLEQAGVTLMKPTDRTGHYEILIPYNNTSLYEVFRDSKWQGELGAGSWTGSLRQASPEIWREASARINGQKAKGTAFALKDIIVSEDEARG